MIQFKLFSIQFMADNDTINWKEHTITIRHNIKLIHVTLSHYPEQLYTIKKTTDIVYNWNKFLKYWIKHLPEYTKAFNIQFDTLTLDIDYSIAPIYISNDSINDTIYIGIYIFNTTIIKHMNNNNAVNSIMDNQEKKNKLVSYSFLSKIEPYLLSNKYTNTKKDTKKDTNNTNYTNNINNTNKYNFIYGILSNNKDDTFKNKGFILDTKLNIPIPIKYSLQNSMNYLPKLEINRIKMSSQNLLNP